MVLYFPVNHQKHQVLIMQSLPLPQQHKKASGSQHACRQYQYWIEYYVKQIAAICLFTRLGCIWLAWQLGLAMFNLRLQSDSLLTAKYGQKLSQQHQSFSSLTRKNRLQHQGAKTLLYLNCRATLLSVTDILWCLAEDVVRPVAKRTWLQNAATKPGLGR